MSIPMALVTGANGWLGRNLVQAIVRGLPDVPCFSEGTPERPVRCLVLPGEDTTFLESLGQNVEIHYGNIAHADSLAAFFDHAHGATVFHCAGVIHPNNGVRQFYEVNVDGTRNLIFQAEASGVKRFIHISSNSPIGCNPHPDHVFDESSPYNPYMNYGKSKKLAEDIVNSASGRGVIETVIIRPPWFYGPHQPPRQTLFFSMIKDGRFPVIGDGLNRRSMAYVDNVCQGALLCEQEQKAAGHTYWMADPRPYTMNEIIDTVEKVMEQDFAIKVTRRRLRLPSITAHLALILDRTLQGVGLYSQSIHVLSEMNKTIACSIAKAEYELGFDPKIQLAEGMRRSIQYVLEKGCNL